MGAENAQKVKPRGLAAWRAMRFALRPLLRGFAKNQRKSRTHTGADKTATQPLLQRSDAVTGGIYDVSAEVRTPM